jgi:pSer/pThr/pTyr-binding forkhead associated (FHA) protein
MSETTDSQFTLDMMKLCIEDDEGVKATYPLLHNEIRVGRSPDNEICLNQRNVSREHAIFYVNKEDQSLVVQDLDSYTGVKLNGKYILGRCTLRLGDYLQIGVYGISLEIEGMSSAATQKEAERRRQESEVMLLPPEQHARLVVVSNNLAGREYYLNRAEVIIGREPSENDLVINHRSISRIHAKIVWKNGEFTMIDLSSANGMKINGSTFAAARLVKGAVIQLGNVKLRYVAPGEDYQYNPLNSEPIPVEDNELDQPRSSKHILIAALVFVIIFMLSRTLINRLNESSVRLTPSQDVRDRPSPPTIDPVDLSPDQIEPPRHEQAPQGSSHEGGDVQPAHQPKQTSKSDSSDDPTLQDVEDPQDDPTEDAPSGIELEVSPESNTDE